LNASTQFVFTELHKNMTALQAAREQLIIDEIEIIPLDIVPRMKRKISTGPLLYGDPGSWIGRPVLLRISAGGLSGWGEVRPVNPWIGETAASVFSCLRDFYGPVLLGRNALDIERTLRACHAKLPGNLAALEVTAFALHDLVGKALGVPAHVLLGGAQRDSIPLEWSVGLADDKTMIEESVMVSEKYGIEYVCIKVGPEEKIEDDARVVKEIRKAIGPKVKLGIDANMGYSPVGAVQLAKRIEEVNLTYFEQPVPPTHIDNLKWVYDRVDVSIIADESCYSPADAARLCATGAADVMAVKFYKCGGLRRGRDIATIADSFGLRANVAGTANGSYLEAIAGATLAAAIPNHAFGAEFVMGLPSVDQDPIVKNRPIDVKNGHCNLPPGPGFGVELDMEQISKLALDRAVVRKK
jgi:L-alanine-DL-glutamate epimerase-like enolase superfamily enzyme